MDTVKIVGVSPNNVAQLQDISVQTFSETFSAVNTAEDMTQLSQRELVIK